MAQPEQHPNPPPTDYSKLSIDDLRGRRAGLSTAITKANTDAERDRLRDQLRRVNYALKHRIFASR